MLMQPNLDLKFQGLPEIELASTAQYLRDSKRNFQNIEKMALRGQLKSNTKNILSSQERGKWEIGCHQSRWITRIQLVVCLLQ